MLNSALIIGYGSIGRRHARILKNKIKIKEVTICTRQKINRFKTLRNLSDLKTRPSYIVIASPTSEHFKQLKYIEKNFKNVPVLVEKPLFKKNKKFSIKNNKIFVGYNLRFHPIIKYLKKNIRKKEIIDIKVYCNSYLPDWRKNLSYEKSSSAHKKLGGGVILDLSHELDLVRWLFGEVSIKFIQKGKYSNLLIDTEDLLKLYGKIGKTNLSIDLNYFSRIKKRTIVIDGDNFSIFADLINNKIELKSKRSNFTKNFYSFKVDDTYIQQHKAIFSKNMKIVCNYDFAKNTMKLIDKIKKWKNK